MSPAAPPNETAPVRRRRWLVGAAVALALGATWSAREPLADHLIDEQLAAMHLPGRYRIVSLSPVRQELADVVLGDPAHPDLTARRLVLHTGLAGVTGVEVDGLRLYGQVRGGRLSWGSLDWWLAQPSAPLHLPDWETELRDARVSIGGEWGAAGLALSGRGNLAEGFAGRVAGYAPALEARHCRAGGVRLGGAVVTRAGQAGLAGMLTATDLGCKGGGLALAAPRLALVARAPASLAEARLDWRLASGGVGLAGLAAAGGSGQGWLRLSGAQLAGGYRLGLERVAGAGLVAQRLEGIGALTGGTGPLTAKGRLTGTGLALAPATFAALERARSGAAASPAAPLLDRLVAGLRSEGRSGTLSGDYALARDGAGLRLAVPALAWRGRGGGVLAAGTDLALGADGAIGGRLELGGGLRAALTPRPGGTRATFTLAAPLRAGGSTLTLPALSAAWDGRRLAFTGRAELSGPLPGGRVERLAVPLSGGWSATGGLVLGRTCQPVAFAGLTSGALALGAGRFQVCPDGPALMAGGRLAGRVPQFALAGQINGRPLQLTGGPLVLDSGGLALTGLEARLGPGAVPLRLTLGRATARFGPQLFGTFADADGAGGDLPLMFSSLGGKWRLADGRLVVDEVSARLTDRPAPGALPRFNPLNLDGGQLVLADGAVQASAKLRHPGSGRVLAELSATHQLATRSGGARISLPGLLFDPKLQPAMLSPLAEGVAENVVGTVSGEGRIDWADGKLTSSGVVETPGLDLAAAFGPARGVAGRVVFTDLLGLVTPPGQQLRIAAINPGIEVNDGVLRFALAPGRVLRIEGAEWPFLSGHLRLRPTSMTLGAAEVRRYVLEAEGIDAGEFLQRMDLPNLSATGRFDGVLPLVFDADGGRAEGGQLVSRPGGGNVSYVGALSYRDLSPMANFAFQTLRSLDYQKMHIGIDGSLAGEVVTRVSFEGISQGKLARRNVLTRQLARIPIHFNVNVRGNFYEVIQSMAATYDPLALCRLLQNRLGANDRARLGIAASCGRIAPAPEATPNLPQPPVQPSSSEHRP